MGGTKWSDLTNCNLITSQVCKEIQWAWEVNHSSGCNLNWLSTLWMSKEADRVKMKLELTIRVALGLAGVLTVERALRTWLAAVTSYNKIKKIRLNIRRTVVDIQTICLPRFHNGGFPAAKIACMGESPRRLVIKPHLNCLNLEYLHRMFEVRQFLDGAGETCPAVILVKCVLVASAWQTSEMKLSTRGWNLARAIKFSVYGCFPTE